MVLRLDTGMSSLEQDDRITVKSTEKIARYFFICFIIYLITENSQPMPREMVLTFVCKLPAMSLLPML